MYRKFYCYCKIKKRVTASLVIIVKYFVLCCSTPEEKQTQTFKNSSKAI